MWWIVYRIAFPGLFIMISFLLLAFSQIRSYKKPKGKKRDKRNKNSIIAYLLIALFGAVLSVICSLDLIFQDFISINGSYEKQYRSRDVYELIFEVNGENERCFISPIELRKYDLQEGQSYEIVYAKRTGMLISIKEAS